MSDAAEKNPLAEYPRTMAPGIYFDLPEEDYHADPSLSASGIKDFLVSPIDYWARSWMNSQYVPADKAAYEIGKAFHARILEGREVFYSRYASDLTAEETEGALVTADDLKEALKALGEKTSGKKADLVERLQEADPGAKILDVMREEHIAKHAGKGILAPDLIEKIELAAAMIESHEQLRHAFSGGYPEVSIFWHDPQTGVPHKARLDYLKRKAVTDLKTFSNPMRQEVDRIIRREISMKLYFLQVAQYLEAVERAKRLITSRTGVLSTGGYVDQGWIKNWLAEETAEFWFIFQQSGSLKEGTAPLARGLRMPPDLGTLGYGKMIREQVNRKWLAYWTVHGSDPWVDTTPIQQYSDDDWPQWLTFGGLDD